MMTKIGILALFLGVSSWAQSQSQITLNRPPATVALFQHTDTFAITSTTTSVTLSAVPISQMGVVWYFSSSQLGSDAFGSFAKATQTITITPPNYASLGTVSGQDVLTLVYYAAQ